MENLKNYKLLILGVLISLITVFVIGFISWKALINAEANRYGKLFLNQALKRVRQVDVLTSKVIDDDFFEKHHHQSWDPTFITSDPEAFWLLNEIKKISNNPEALLAFFTDCNDPDESKCYVDNDPPPVEPKRHFYFPKSRPWYLATRTHTDWVLINYMMSGKTKAAGYPAFWGLGLVKHFAKKENFSIPKNQQGEYVSNAKEPDHGLWVSTFLNQSNLPQRDLNRGTQSRQSVIQSFSLFAPDDTARFFGFRADFKTLIYPKALLEKKIEPTLSCRSISESRLISYAADVFCFFNQEPIHFYFFKRYDALWHLSCLVIVLAGLAGLMILAFRKMNQLQRKSIQQTLQIEIALASRQIGAKLVHDLKKGIVSQLNLLKVDCDNFFRHCDKNTASVSEFQKNLKTHFDSLDLLNRHVQLMSDNLNRKKERSWVPLTPQLFQTYLKWMSLESHLITAEPSDNLFLRSVYDPKDRGSVTLTTSQYFPDFMLPEIAFFRILKNIFENFHAHGTGTLMLSMKISGDEILVKSQNKIMCDTPRTPETTSLGLQIIEQLLVDNFDNQAKLQSQSDGSEYTITLQFPQVMHDKRI